MRCGTNSTNNLRGFSLETMRNLLYFLAPSLTFKVSCYFALSFQTLHRCFAVLKVASFLLYAYGMVLCAWYNILGCLI